MATTAKGHTERLPSGSYRVTVYAGTDPVTGKERRLLRDMTPDDRTTAIALGRLLREAEGPRPERDALFGRVLDVYLEVTELAASTRVTQEPRPCRGLRHARLPSSPARPTSAPLSFPPSSTSSARRSGSANCSAKWRTSPTTSPRRPHC
jgi:hypothetical protein